MKIVGVILILFGLVDLVGSYADFDLWGGFLGIQLPDLLWKFSSYIEMGIGFLLVNLSGGEATDEADTDVADAAVVDTAVVDTAQADKDAGAR